MIILLVSLFGMKALFHPGLFTAHDIWHQVVRLYYYSQAVNDGQFPPYWIGQLANKFGYPLFFFSYNLPWLISIPIMKIGFDITATIKILFILSYIGSGITMYFFVNSLLKDKLSAFISSILYLWLPYHFLIIFVSASMGIAFVFTFLPLLFLGIHLSSEGSKFGSLILALGLSGIILSHIMHLVFLSPLILIISIWELSRTKTKMRFIKSIIIGITLGFSISAFYLIPATYYNQFTRVHREEGIVKLYERNFIYFKQLIYSKWGFSPIVNNAKNEEISFQIGIAQWICVIIITLLIVLRKIPRQHIFLSISLIISFIVCIFFMLDISKPIWKILVTFINLDYPFRLLLPASFIASICGGIVILTFRGKVKLLVLIFIILVAFYTNRNHININQYTNFPVSTYLDLPTEITTSTFNEYLPIQANPQLLDRPWNEIIGDVSVSKISHTTNLLSFQVDIPTKQTVSLGQFYFPGQNLYIDGKVSQFDVDKDGRISFIAPQGIHKIEDRYQDTTVIYLSKNLTLIGLFIMIFLPLKDKILFKKKAYS